MPQPLLEHSRFNQLCLGKHGYFLYNSFDSYVGRSMAKYGEWSEGEVELFTHFCKPGDIVIEAGSNIGAHTVPLAKMIGDSGRLYSFEPQRLVFQTLCANIALNSLLNVENFNMAVGATAGTAIIPEYPYTIENNFGGTRIREGQAGVPVSQITLDSFLNLPSLTFLKADIEGMELPMLKGAQELIERFKPVLYLENDCDSPDSHALIQHVLSLGYRIFWHVVYLYNPANYAGEAEDIFVNTASFNMLCIHASAMPASLPAGLKELHDANDKPF